jgi:hypothetical protein
MKELIILLCLIATVARAGDHRIKFEYADCGPPPANAEAITRRYLLEEALIDPDSAKITFIKVEPSILEPYGRKPNPCWTVKFKVNARNSFGGYTGWKTVLVDIDRNGKAVDVFTLPWIGDPK